MFRISKQFYFSASHTLDTLSKDHPCSHLHGHNYIVEIVLQSEALNKHGFVVDFLELKPLKEYIDNELDHCHLNEVLPFPPSCENIAKHLYKWAKVQWSEVVCVRIHETEKTWAEYYE